MIVVQRLQHFRYPFGVAHATNLAFFQPAHALALRF
jgi:hypothetical protein